MQCCRCSNSNKHNKTHLHAYKSVLFRVASTKEPTPSIFGTRESHRHLSPVFGWCVFKVACASALDQWINANINLGQINRIAFCVIRPPIYCCNEIYEIRFSHFYRKSMLRNIKIYFKLKPWILARILVAEILSWFYALRSLSTRWSS